jgi:hypothetical protein
MPSTVLAAAATAGVNYGASKLFGKKTDTSPNFAAPGFTAGGLSAMSGNGGFRIIPDAERLGLVQGISSGFGEQADILGGIRASVAPGMSELRAQRLGEIENARSSAIGNLRENLQRRRVLGSSFGQDTISRAESEFAGQRDKVAAETFLQELDMTTQVLQQEFQARRSSFQTNLDELNLQADLAAKLTAGATAQLGANARLEASLSAQEAAGAGKFFGQTFEPVGKAIGKGFGNLFSGSSSSNLNLMPTSI